MKSKFQLILKKSFVRNVIVMVTGTAAAQAISMVLSPITTRLYGPEAYGLMGSFIAIVAILVPIASLTYPIAIVLPKSDLEAKGLIHLSLTISTIIAGIMFIILLLFNQTIINLFNLSEIRGFVYLIPLAILFAGILQVTEQWLIRMKQFKISARVTFIQALITQGSIVCIGVFYPLASILVIIQSLKDGLKAFLIMLFMRKKEGNKLLKINNKQYSRKILLKKYYEFPVFRAPEAFLNALSQSLPILMLTSFFGPASAGFYSICKTVLNMPAQLVGKSVGDVFYPRVAEAANNKENVTGLIKKATLILAFIGIIPFGIVIILGPWLFRLVFGVDWIDAGEYARWISLWSFFALINIPSVKSLPVLSAQAFQLKYTVFMLVTRLVLLGIGYYFFNNDKIAIALFGISGALLNLGLILITFKISKKFDKVRVGKN
ncbi:lipopolysaccharide biosynthesis protein [Bacillus massilinigeriensis]|uniref:lipopolysaccharide biosynthesis protein n=1 Tax=Bacillus mediterraneensis TaxID=1805474 RepID=UPI0008F8805C|nr:oligosaccharide flippase family protein [Bacillus mediterraneensis]